MIADLSWSLGWIQRSVCAYTYVAGRRGHHEPCWMLIQNWFYQQVMKWAGWSLLFIWQQAHLTIHTNTLKHINSIFISASQIFMHMKLNKQVSCCFATLYKSGTNKLINCVSQTACLLLCCRKKRLEIIKFLSEVSVKVKEIFLPTESWICLHILQSGV